MENEEYNTRIGYKLHVITFILVIGLITIFMLSLALGSVDIPFSSTLSILFGQNADPTYKTIIMQLRLPRSLAAVFGGAALSIAGLQMQTLFKNPLADPYILGISSGASLGVALVIMLSSITTVATIPELMESIGVGGIYSLAFAAFLGSASVLIIILVASKRIESNVTILVLGLMFGYFTSSIVTILMNFSSPESVKAFVEWGFGSFDLRWMQLQILIPIIVLSLISSFLLSKSLNALLLGEGYATSMGMNVRKTRIAIIITTAMQAGIVTAFCGPIAFIGVAVPHLCKSLFMTADHRILVPGCILVGAILSVFAGIIAHLPGSDLVLPLNAITSLLGAPVVIWIIFRASKFGKDVV